MPIFFPGLYIPNSHPLRKRAYVHRVFYLNEYAKEIRLNPDITNRLYKEFESTNGQIRDIEKKYAKKRSLLSFVTNYLTNDFISDVIYITYLVFRAAVKRTISYSSVIVFWNISGQLRHSLRTIATVFPQLSENSLYIEKIRGFLGYEQKITSSRNLPVPQTRGTLELRNVSFGYTEKDGPILKNISLAIHPEEKVALVGYNGAGKTTLIKLIMRLYDPNEGQILYNGIDIRDYDVNGYRKHIGTIFQDFKIFAAAVGENVVLDEDEASVEKKHKPAVLQALDYSGFTERLEKLPQGLATELTTEFEKEGVDLSGGESQQLAIARAFYKDAPRGGAGRALQRPRSHCRVSAEQDHASGGGREVGCVHLPPAVDYTPRQPYLHDGKWPDHRGRHPRRAGRFERQIRSHVESPGRKICVVH